MAGLLNAGITPVVHEYGSLGCSGDLAPLAHCALALIGEGEVRDASGTLMPAAEALRGSGPHAGRPGRQGGPGADQRHRRHARHAGAGADGPLRPDAYGGHRRRHVGRGPARHRPGLRPRAAGDPATPRPGGLRRQPHRDPARTPGSSPRTADRTATGCRTPTRCAARPQVHGAARDTLEHCATVAGRELASAVDNPVVVSTSDDEAGRVQRQLPRRPGRLRARLRGDRGRRRGLDQRAAYGPVPRQGPQPRAAAVPRPRPGRRQRAHDRAVHPGRDRLGAQAARRTGQRRLDPVQRDAGGPRVDGLVRGAQAASFGRRAHPRRRRSRCSPRPGRSTSVAPWSRPRRPLPSSTCCAPRGSRAPARTAISRPRSRPPSGWSARVPSCMQSKK